jgi:hypothetical protein
VVVVLSDVQAGNGLKIIINGEVVRYLHMYPRVHRTVECSARAGCTCTRKYVLDRYCNCVHMYQVSHISKYNEEELDVISTR